jgi:membrane-associated protein
MLNIFQFIFNPEWILSKFGHLALLIFLVVVFAETGLFIGLFLPGDSLLFTAGIFGDTLSKSFFNIPFIGIIILVAIMAIIGNILGYWIGYKSGALLFDKGNSFLFRKKYLLLAQDFYLKHKTMALIVSRFLPIFRTFAPIVAGIVKVNFKDFMIFNIIGAITWAFSIMMAGHYLDRVFPNLKNNLGWIVIIIFIITIIPLCIKCMVQKKRC